MDVILAALGAARDGFRRWVADAASYRELDPDHRHLFWKRVQAAVFLALMPLFVVLGAATRVARSASPGMGRRARDRG